MKPNFSLIGTLFWFPLRRSPSLLLEKIYPPERMIELITSFTKEADNILLFLHNVNKIIIMENEGQVLYENTIEKTDKTRKDLVEFWEYLKNISTNHETTHLQNSKAVTYNAQVVTNDVKEGRRKTYLFKIIHYFQGKTRYVIKSDETVQTKRKYSTCWSCISNAV